MVKNIISLTILVLMVLGCAPKKPESMKFSGVTLMDKFGTFDGKPDTTDWRCDDVWTAREAALFKDSIDNECAPKHYKVLFYPNPCRQKSTLFAFKDPKVRMAIRLVDKDMNVILSNDDVNPRGLEFDLSSFKTDDTIRVYYKFFAGDSCEYRGHGDIWVHPYK